MYPPPGLPSKQTAPVLAAASVNRNLVQLPSGELAAAIKVTSSNMVNESTKTYV